MSFSSRRRNYLLTPHRRDGLIEWMKSMLTHSFVLDALETTGADTFSHFEILIEEHRQLERQRKELLLMSGSGATTTTTTSAASSSSSSSSVPPSRLKQLVPTVGTFHTHLPLRQAFEFYNTKHRLTKRRHIQISFNEIRHILNLAQIMAMSQNCYEKATPSSISATSTTGDDRHTTVPTNQKVDENSNEILIDPALSQDDFQLLQKQQQQQQQQQRQHQLDDSDLVFGDVEDDTPNANAATLLSNSSLRVIGDTSGGGGGGISQLRGPKMITFDGDQTLYSDGANFDSNPKLATYLWLLLKHGVTVAVVTAAGYEYNVEKYEYRLSGLLNFFQMKGLTAEECERFYLFGGECNYLLNLGSDYHLHAVREQGPGGWLTSTRYIPDTPGNWLEEQVQTLLDVAEEIFATCLHDLNMRGRIVRKRRSVGLVPTQESQLIPREALDETVLRVQEKMQQYGRQPPRNHHHVLHRLLPYCAFNGGKDVWVDIGNKRVGVQILQSYLGIPAEETLHIGDQFLNTGNDFAARDVCPCIWITSPEETTYILKTILRLAEIPLTIMEVTVAEDGTESATASGSMNFAEIERRTRAVKRMDVYTGEISHHETEP